MSSKPVTTLTEIQLADRSAAIGASDCAAALGLSVWKTALQLYLEKRGEIALDDLSENERVEWGVRLEPAVRQKYADVTGRAVRLSTDTSVNPALPWMIAHPDGLTEDDRLYEGKVAGSVLGWGEPGSSDVPQEYFLQCQHGMIVLSAQLNRKIAVADLAVLIGGNIFRLYEIPADREIQEMILDGECEFMRRVKTAEPPAPNFNAQNTRALLAKMFPGTTGEVLAATNAQILWRTVYDEAYAKARVYTDVFEGAKSALMFDMGEAAQLTFPDGKSLRRKLVKRKAYAVEATEYMDTRFTSTKE